MMKVRREGVCLGERHVREWHVHSRAKARRAHMRIQRSLRQIVRVLRETRSGAASSQYVTITSYNEWGEGTQIEPASLNTNVESLASFEGRKNKKYLEYPNDEWFFMNRTKYWSEKWNENFKEKKGMLNNVDL